MIKNLSNYKVGDRLIIRPVGNQYTTVEAELFEKANKMIKVKIITNGWWGINEVRWFKNSDIDIVQKLKTTCTEIPF